MTAITLREVRHFAFPKANGQIVGVNEVDVEAIHFFDTLVGRLNCDRVKSLAPPIEPVITLKCVVRRNAVVHLVTVGADLKFYFVFGVTWHIDSRTDLGNDFIPLVAQSFFDFMRVVIGGVHLLLAYLRLIGVDNFDVHENAAFP